MTQTLDLDFGPGEVVAVALSDAPFAPEKPRGASVKVSLADPWVEGGVSEVQEVGEVTRQEAEQVDKLLTGYSLKAAGPGVEAMTEIMARGYAKLKKAGVLAEQALYVDDTPLELAELFAKKGQPGPFFLVLAMAQDPEYLEYMRGGLHGSEKRWSKAAGGEVHLRQVVNLLKDGTPHGGATHTFEWVYVPEGWTHLFPVPGY